MNQFLTPLLKQSTKIIFSIFLLAPAPIDKKIQTKAQHLAEKSCSNSKVPGCLAIEMFLNQTGDVFINEIAPRVHNSGHYTIEAMKHHNLNSSTGNHRQLLLNQK